jgi:hypothetical protein
MMAWSELILLAGGKKSQQLFRVIDFVYVSNTFLIGLLMPTVERQSDLSPDKNKNVQVNHKITKKNCLRFDVELLLFCV